MLWIVLLIIAAFAFVMVWDRTLGPFFKWIGGA